MTLILEPEKFSQLPVAGPLTGPEIIPIVQGGVNKKTTVNDLPIPPSGVQSIVAGENIAVDDTDPANPVVSSTGGGDVESVNGQSGVVVLDTDDINDTSTNRYTSDADVARLADTSGENTGDQDLSGLVPNTRTVNGHALSADVTVTKTDVGLGQADNTSDLDKPVSTAAQTALDLKEDKANKGIALGYASLDSGGKVPVAQLPSSVMTYLGTWDAATNTPTLANGTGDAGDLYICNVAGTVNFGAGPITFEVGDWVMYNGSIWQRSDMSDAVSSVFGRQGAVTAQNGDYTASQVTNVAAGNIIATTVQAAIDELDTEKVAKSGDTMTGNLTTPTVLISNTAGGLGGSTTGGQIRVFGGTLNDGAGLVLTGSTNGFPSRGLIRVGATTIGQWNTGGLALGGSVDPTHTLTLPSTATGIVLYNTADQTTNYERVRQYWSGNAANIRTEVGGTGTGRNLVLGTVTTTLTISNSETANGTFQLTRATNTGTGVHTIINGTATQASGLFTGLAVTNVINQSSTAGYTMLLVNPTESAVGSGTKLLADFQVGGSSKASISNTGQITIATAGIRATGLIERSSFANAQVLVTTTGTSIERNIADANTALTVNQIHASSTGAILDAKFGGVSKFKVLYTGRVTLDSVDGNAIDIDGTLAANSDTKLASQKATKTYSDTKIPKSLVTAKGNVIAASASSTPVNVPVGSDGQVLTADAASTPGVKWANPSTGGLGLVPTAVKTSNYTASVNDMVLADTNTTGAFTVTLPSAPADKSLVAIKHVLQGSTGNYPNVLTVACGGSDVFDKASGPTSVTIPLLNSLMIFQYQSSTGVWHQDSDHHDLSVLDSRLLSATTIIPQSAFAGTGADMMTPLVSGNAAGTYALTAGSIIMALAIHSGQTVNVLEVHVSATSLTAGQAITIGCYAYNANGTIGALLWSQAVTIGTSTGAIKVTGLSKVMPTGRCAIAVLNPSTNAGSVTLRAQTSQTGRGLPIDFQNGQFTHSLLTSGRSALDADFSSVLFRAAVATNELTPGPSSFPIIGAWT